MNQSLISEVVIFCWYDHKRSASLRCVYLANSGLQHGVKASLRCVHVPGDPLLLNDPRELCHVLGDGEDVDEAMSGPAVHLIITETEKERDLQHVIHCRFPHESQ